MARRDGEPAVDLLEALVRLVIVFLLSFAVGLERHSFGSRARAVHLALSDDLDVAAVEALLE